MSYICKIHKTPMVVIASPDTPDIVLSCEKCHQEAPKDSCKNCKWNGVGYDLNHGDVIMTNEDGSCAECGRYRNRWNPAPKEQEGWREELYKANFYQDLPPSSQASLQGFIDILLTSQREEMIERVLGAEVIVIKDKGDLFISLNLNGESVQTKSNMDVTGLPVGEFLAKHLSILKGK